MFPAWAASDAGVLPFEFVTCNSDNTSGSWGFEDLNRVSAYQGAPALANGRLGDGLYLDGATVAQLTDSGRLSPTSAISVEMWLRPLSVGTTGYCVSKVGEFYFPRLNQDGSLDAQLSLTSGSVALRASNAASTNIWKHLALTYDGSAVKLYANGVLSSSQAANGTVSTSTYPVLMG